MCSLILMTRKGILEVTENIYSVLKKDKEKSIKGISDEIGSQWRTTLKSLEFLKNIGVVRERKGKKTHKEERLFSLKDPSEKYGK